MLQKESYCRVTAYDQDWIAETKGPTEDVSNQLFKDKHTVEVRRRATALPRVCAADQQKGTQVDIRRYAALYAPAGVQQNKRGTALH